MTATMNRDVAEKKTPASAWLSRRVTTTVRANWATPVTAAPTRLAVPPRAIRRRAGEVSSTTAGGEGSERSGLTVRSATADASRALEPDAVALALERDGEVGEGVAQPEVNPREPGARLAVLQVPARRLDQVERDGEGGLLGRHAERADEAGRGPHEAGVGLPRI